MWFEVLRLRKNPVSALLRMLCSMTHSVLALIMDKIAWPLVKIVCTLVKIVAIDTNTPIINTPVNTPCVNTSAPNKYPC